MRNKIKVGAIAKVIHANRMIRRVGLDSDIMIVLIDDSKHFSLFKPKIFNRKNVVFGGVKN